MTDPDKVLQRELEYHERLYSGFAQQHFAKPAVRALREHMVRRILSLTGATASSSVLSLGCGIGDTEILLAPHVGMLTGVDLSPTAIRQAREDAAGLTNVRFEEGTLETIEEAFDVVIAIFLLHHIPDAGLQSLPALIKKRLKPGGVFYAVDPSRHRLSGFVGSLVCPKVMAKYQTEDERELDARQTAKLFRDAGFDCRTSFYDFVSTPLAGLFPSWRLGYRASRVLDNALVHVPGVRLLSSNFEIVGRQ